MSDAERVIDPETQVELLVPSWATPESVVRREALKREGLLRRIRFWNEWGHAWPLWEDYPIEPD